MTLPIRTTRKLEQAVPQIFFLSPAKQLLNKSQRPPVNMSVVDFRYSLWEVLAAVFVFFWAFLLSCPLLIQMVLGFWLWLWLNYEFTLCKYMLTKVLIWVTPSFGRT